MKYRKFLSINFPENFLFKRARRVLLIRKILGLVTEETFEIKGNVSCKVYFRFLQFCAAFLFPVSCACFTFISKSFDACNFEWWEQVACACSEKPFRASLSLSKCIHEQQSNWRPSSITILCRILVCFFFFVQMSWIFACDLRFNRKSQPCIFFHWFALRFPVKTYAKNSAALFAVCCRTRQAKQTYCFPEQWNQRNVL